MAWHLKMRKKKLYYMEKKKKEKSIYIIPKYPMSVLYRSKWRKTTVKCVGLLLSYLFGWFHSFASFKSTFCYGWGRMMWQTWPHYNNKSIGNGNRLLQFQIIMQRKKKRRENWIIQTFGWWKMKIEKSK